MFTYDIASREVSYWVLSSERHRAEHDEDEDEVCEDLMVYQFMAEHTKPTEEGEKNKGRNRICVVEKRLFLWFLLLTHGFVLLKMKKALPTGMGGVLSFIVRSDNL